MENATEVIPHCLGGAMPLLSEHYNKSSFPFSQTTSNLLQKVDSRETLHPKAS